MTVKIYPSKIDGDPLEVYTLRNDTTFLAWIENNRSALWYWLEPNADRTSIELEKPQAVSLVVNGTYIPQSCWGTYVLTPNDIVVATFEAGWANLAWAVAMLVVSYIAARLLIKTPKSNYHSHDAIDMATLQGNQVKKNQVIREAFGRNRIYGDYLVQNRVFFEDNYQWTYMHLGIGVGTYQINAAEIYIGNTALSSFGDYGSYEVFAPGADVTGNDATENWYPSPEVGTTNSGDSGLLLKETYDVDSSYHPDSASVGSATSTDDEGTSVGGGYISVGESVGSFPNGWQSGLFMKIYDPQDVTFGGYGTGNYFIGNFDNVTFEEGDLVTIEGDLINDTYQIIAVETESTGEIHYYLGNASSGTAITWISDISYYVCIQLEGSYFEITSTDATGTWTDEDNDGVNDTDEDDDDTNDDEYTPPQQIIVQRLLSDGTVDTDWEGFTTRTTVDFYMYLTEATGGWQGPFAACPVNETATVFEFDFYLPNGLYKVHDNGNYKSAYVTLEISYRDARDNTASWTTKTYTISEKSTDALAFTYSITSPDAIRPLVRMRMSDHDTTSSGSIYYDTYWYGLRAKLDRPDTYDDITSIAIKVRTGERLAAQSESQVWCYATRELAPYDASSTTLTATRSISDAIISMLGNLSYTSSNVDMTTLASLQSTWTTNSQYFDMQFTDETALKDAINYALGAGYAELTIDKGYLVPVYDGARTTFDHMYSPQNMTSELQMSLDMYYAGDTDHYDGLTVTFDNIETGQSDTVDCWVGDDSGDKMATATCYGINTRTRAWRWGMRQRAIAKYRKRAYQFTTGFDALNSGYLDYCQISADYPGYSVSGRVIGYERPSDGYLYLVLDQPVEMDSGTDYIISFRSSDGSPWGSTYYTVEEIDSEGRVVIADPDYDPETDYNYDMTHFVFGPVDKAFFPVLIQSVTCDGDPLGDSEPTVTVKAVNYDSRVYAADSETPPSDA